MKLKEIDLISFNQHSKFKQNLNSAWSCRQTKNPDKETLVYIGTITGKHFFHFYYLVLQNKKKFQAQEFFIAKWLYFKPPNFKA